CGRRASRGAAADGAARHAAPGGPDHRDRHRDGRGGGGCVLGRLGGGGGAPGIFLLLGSGGGCRAAAVGRGGGVGGGALRRCAAPAADRRVELGRTMAASEGPPPSEVLAEMPLQQARLKVLARISFGLLIVAALAMATARYW